MYFVKYVYLVTHGLLQCLNDIEILQKLSKLVIIRIHVLYRRQTTDITGVTIDKTVIFRLVFVAILLIILSNTCGRLKVLFGFSLLVPVLT